MEDNPLTKQQILNLLAPIIVPLGERLGINPRWLFDPILIYLGKPDPLSWTYTAFLNCFPSIQWEVILAKDQRFRTLIINSQHFIRDN